VQTFHYRGVFVGNAISVWLGAIGGGDSRGVQQVLAAPGDAVKGSAILSSRDFPVGVFRLAQG